MKDQQGRPPSKDLPFGGILCPRSGAPQARTTDVSPQAKRARLIACLNEALLIASGYEADFHTMTRSDDDNYQEEQQDENDASNSRSNNQR